MFSVPMKICIIGTGYVGLVTGACLAEIGHEVICVDNAPEKIKMLNSGQMPIYEPGLEELVKKNALAGRLKFTSSTKDGVERSDIIFIAVPTPAQPDGSVDLSFIDRVSQEIAELLTRYKIIIDKSVVPVGTGDKVAETIRRYCKSKVAFDVVSNPEFMRGGYAVNDFLHPDRIVLGVQSQRPVHALKEIYAPLNANIIVTDINSAELIKHASNSFLALKVAYINAISVICEETGANIEEVAQGMGLDKRIGKDFLNASLGFGGSCFPKELSTFIRIAEERGYDFGLLREVQRINAQQMERFVRKIADTLWVIKDKTIGILGLAFKQNTDDVRLSPAVALCQRLRKEGAHLRVYDPKAMNKAKMVLKEVTFVGDMNQVADGCDALVVATEWPEFKKLDLEYARERMTHPILFDGRNLFDPKKMEDLGFIYKSIGR